MLQSVRKSGSMTLVLAAVLLLAGRTQPGTARTPGRMAQPPAGIASPVTETLTYDHVHFGVPDQAKAVEWYAKYMGGQPGPAGEPNERLLFGKTRFIFLKNDKPLPSAGSAVDHIGLSYTDLAAKMKELEMAGVKILERDGAYRLSRFRSATIMTRMSFAF
jgi:hypothetical protein